MNNNQYLLDEFNGRENNSLNKTLLKVFQDEKLASYFSNFAISHKKEMREDEYLGIRDVDFTDIELMFAIGENSKFLLVQNFVKYKKAENLTQSYFDFFMEDEPSIFIKENLVFDVKNMKMLLDSLMYYNCLASDKHFLKTGEYYEFKAYFEEYLKALGLGQDLSSFDMYEHMDEQMMERVRENNLKVATVKKLIAKNLLPKDYFINFGYNNTAFEVDLRNSIKFYEIMKKNSNNEMSK